MMNSSFRVTFDGPALLQEQTDMLAQATPADINYLQYLKLKRSAQQKATVQRNQYRRYVGSEERSQSRLSLSVLPNLYKANTPNNSIVFQRESGVDDSAMYPGESVNDSRRGWESTLPPPPASRRLRDDIVNASRAGPSGGVGGSSGGNPLDDVPASVTKRRSMKDFSGAMGRSDAPASPQDEMPAVAGSRSGAFTGVPEQPTEAVPLETCPHCGRTFAQGRLSKHVDTCKRQQEREQDVNRRKPTSRTATHRSSLPDGNVSGTGNSLDSRKASLVQVKRRAAASTSQQNEFDEL